MTSERTGAVSAQNVSKRKDGIRGKLWISDKFMSLVAEPLLVDRAFLDGAENLKEARDLLAQGKHVVIVANHRSNADAPAIDVTLSRNGFGDLAQKCVYLFGLKLEQQIVTRTLGQCFPTIIVWPPTIEPRNEGEVEKRKLMAIQSLRAVRNVYKNGKILVLFPEGGRSRTEGMCQGFAGVEGYIADTLVVPIAIEGTDKILPVGSVLPKRGSIRLHAGKIIDIKQYEESLTHLDEESPIHLATPEQRKRLVVDRVMFEVARQLPPELRGYYEI